jgi:hypothetical protein
LSTVSIYGRKASARPPRAILDARRSNHRIATAGTSSVRRVLVLLLLLLTPLPNRARPSSLKVPFSTTQEMILVKGKVNGNPATFLLDTGANRTIISARIYGKALLPIPRWPRKPDSLGLKGYSVRRPADLILGEHVWIGQTVSVMDLDELKGMLNLDFDGLIGQDILRQFRSVRIDYRTHVIEMEK